MSGYTIEEIREFFEQYVASSEWDLDMDRYFASSLHDYIDLETNMAFECYRAGFNAVKVPKDEP